MSRRSEQQLNDICKWFLEHKGQATDIEKRVELLETAVVNLILLYSYFVEDVQHIEEGRTNVILPKGVKLNDAIRTGT